MRRVLKVGRRLGTESAIYGTIVYAGLIAAASVHGDEDHPDVEEILLIGVVTVIVFWAAHVFAGTLSHYSNTADHPAGLSAAFRHALTSASGMLEALVIPTLILLLGLAGVLDPARSVTLSLQASVIVLGVLGYLALSARRAKWWWCVLAGAASASLGLIIIVIKAALH